MRLRLRLHPRLRTAVTQGPSVSAGRSLQTAHLRPQLRLGPRNEGRPSDSGNLHPEPPDQEHERCQLVPDHHSTESSQPKIRCVESRGCRGVRRPRRAGVEAGGSLNGSTPSTRSDGMRIKWGKCPSCRSCGGFHVLVQESFSLESENRGWKCPNLGDVGGGSQRETRWGENASSPLDRGVGWLLGPSLAAGSRCSRRKLDFWRARRAARAQAHQPRA